jgi:thioredoxin 1
MIQVVEVNDSQFDVIVLKSSLPVLLECASPECIICKTMASRIQEVIKEYSSKLIFLRLNINESKKWKDYDVRVIPTLLYFKSGRLVGRQENFPEIEEIRQQISRLIKGEPKKAPVFADAKIVLDLEVAAAKFYKYLFSNVKNGKTKEKFKLLHEETVLHKELLQKKSHELAVGVYNPCRTRETEAFCVKPQSFSLVGALKMVIKIEAKLLSLYKKLKTNENFLDKELCVKLIREVSNHLKVAQKEMRFIQDKEFMTAMDSSEYPTWLNKVLD